MIRIFLVSASVCLAGCAFSGAIKENAINYGDVFEDTTDKLLLMNVLRARDKAPLHFADIPSIHQSLQLQAGAQASFPFGPLSHSTVRDSLTPSVQLQSTPSFDISHLDTKDFVTGIASPIDPKFVKYWLDRGVDQNLVLLLFFSSAEILASTDKNGHALNDKSGHSFKEVVQIANAPRGTADQFIRHAENQSRYCGRTEFGLYLSLMNALKSFYAVSYSESSIVAQGLPASLTSDPKNFKQIAALDPTKSKLKPKKDASGNTVSFDLISTSADKKIALCYKREPDSSQNEMSKQSEAQKQPDSSKKDETSKQVESAMVQLAATPQPSQPACSTPSADGLSGGTEESERAVEQRVFLPDSRYCEIYNRFRDSNGLDAGLQLRLAMRSVGEIIQFLGDLLYLEEALATDRKKAAEVDLNVPTTLRYCARKRASDGSRCEQGGYVFVLNNDPAYARFTLEYRGRPYSVRDFNVPSPPGESLEVDHTLEVLAILHQLVDLNKSATDLRVTPFVQTLP